MPDKPNSTEFASAGSSSSKDATEIYDGRYGKYTDEVANNLNTDSKLPTVAMPKQPDPSPFKLGPLGK